MTTVGLFSQEITEAQPVASSSSAQKGGQASNMSSQARNAEDLQGAGGLTSLPTFTALPLLRTTSM